jgi:hypothetical protein
VPRTWTESFKYIARKLYKIKQIFMVQDNSLYACFCFLWDHLRDLGVCGRITLLKRVLKNEIWEFWLDSVDSRYGALAYSGNGNERSVSLKKGEIINQLTVNFWRTLLHGVSLLLRLVWGVLPKTQFLLRGILLESCACLSPDWIVNIH